jgi:hypothetical protein
MLNILWLPVAAVAVDIIMVAEVEVVAFGLAQWHYH